MAGRQTRTRVAQSYQSDVRTNRQMYVYGNVVPKPLYEPKNDEEQEQKKGLSRQVKKNRKKALHMSPGYVLFLGAAAALALIVCANYVQMQSTLTGRSNHITSMQQELANLREENTTKYNSVMDSVNLEEVRDRAQTQLGMVYASPDQIVEYDDPVSEYVKQYENIPKDGVLAQSSKN